MTEPRDLFFSQSDFEAEPAVPPVAPPDGRLGSPDRATASRRASPSSEERSAADVAVAPDAFPTRTSMPAAEPSSVHRPPASKASAKPFLDLAFLTSWRGAFLVAGLISCIVTGSKLVFGPDLGSRLLSLVSPSPYAGAVPSDAIMSLPVAVPSAISIEYSLAELAALMAERMELTFEPVDEHAFVLRATGDDVLLKQPFEIALRFRRSGNSARIFVPSTGGTISAGLLLEALAYNRQEGTALDISTFLVNLQGQILARRTSAAADAARAAESLQKAE